MDGSPIAQPFDTLFKVVLTGSSGVGKSNLLNRFTKDSFSPDSTITIGVEFSDRIVRVSDKVIKVQLWDTAGQERFQAITHAYYRGAHGALLVYDITSRLSFSAIGKWLKEIREQSKRPVVVMLIGNKLDLEAQREVSTEEGQAMATQEHVLFMETSAKEGDKVEDAFTSLVHEINSSQQSLVTHVPSNSKRTGEQITSDLLGNAHRLDTRAETPSPHPPTVKRKRCCVA